MDLGIAVMQAIFPQNHLISSFAEFLLLNDQKIPDNLPFQDFTLQVDSDSEPLQIDEMDQKPDVLEAIDLYFENM